MKLTIKQAYKDVKSKRVKEARKVYKMMWIKDYDFLHHGENYKNTKNAMDKYDSKIENNNFNQDWEYATRLGLNIKK